MSAPPGHFAALERRAPRAVLPESIATREQRFSWWQGLSVPVGLAVGRIGIGLVAAHLFLELFPKSHLPDAILSNGSWLGAFYRWDGNYYVMVATHGYPHASPALTAFFPGFPLISRAVWEVTLGVATLQQTATVVSWLAFIAASTLLYLAVSHRFSQRPAVIAVALFCWSPASLFFLSPYSESLFALEIIAVIVLVERRWFLAAAGVAGFASATSPESVALTAAIVIAAALARRSLASVLGYAAISLTGIIAYMVYLQVRFNSFLEFDRVQKAWHRSLNFPFVGLGRNLHALTDGLVGAGPPPGSTIPTYANIRAIWALDDAMLLAASLVTAYMAWVMVGRLARTAPGRRLATLGAVFPPPWVAAAAVIVLIAACTTIYPYGNTHLSSTEGEARFVAVAMPLYAGLAFVLRRRLDLALTVLALSATTAIVFQMMYNLGYWVT